MAGKVWKVYKKHIGILETQFPDIFNKKDPKILKVGINHDIVRETGLSGVTVRRVLCCWTSRLEYRKVGALGGNRVDLNGCPVSEISEEHVQHFQESLK